MSLISVLLADDHRLVRTGLQAVLDAEADMQVVGVATTGDEALLLVERLRPQVLVVDVMMPGLNGLEVVRTVQQRMPETRVVVLSMHANESYVVTALRNGASGYVLKDADASDLLEAVRAAATGRRYLSQSLSERAIDIYIQKISADDLDPYDALTVREREVLQLAAEGRNNVEIAQRLMISPRTAESHRANILRKLGLNNQTDLVHFAIKRGIIPLG